MKYNIDHHLRLFLYTVLLLTEVYHNMLFSETLHYDSEYLQIGLILNKRKGQIWNSLEWIISFGEFFFVVYFILLFSESAFLILNMFAYKKNVMTPSSYWASVSVRLQRAFQSFSF